MCNTYKQKIKIQTLNNFYISIFLKGKNSIVLSKKININ